MAGVEGATIGNECLRFDCPEHPGGDMKAVQIFNRRFLEKARKSAIPVTFRHNAQEVTYQGPCLRDPNMGCAQYLYYRGMKR